MKIYIIGGSGSGKSYLARRLSKHYQIEHYDLDDLQWDNQAEAYGVERPHEDRNAMLARIVAKEDWIIEGVYYQWVEKAFEMADIIYVLDIPLSRSRCRIIKRFLRRKLGMEKGKKETLKSLYDLWKWTREYQEKDMVKIREMLLPYSEKVYVITDQNKVTK
ncbi:MAG: DNA topology modulation protein FlaR [Blautia sp.]|jgi:adenylate kinase family enzyme